MCAFRAAASGAAAERNRVTIAGSWSVFFPFPPQKNEFPKKRGGGTKLCDDCVAAVRREGGRKEREGEGGRGREREGEEGGREGGSLRTQNRDTWQRSARHRHTHTQTLPT
jgi:hypothetical protein